MFLLLSFAHLRWQPWTLSMGCLQISSIACMHFLYTSHISSGSTLCEFALGYRCSSHVEDNPLKYLSQAGTIISRWGKSHKTEEVGYACIPIGTSTIYTTYYRQHNFPHASSIHNLHLLSRNFLLHETKSWIQTNSKFISYRKNLVYKFLCSL